MNKYEIGMARGEIDNFFWRDFCDYYLEIAKERLYNQDNKYGDKQKSAQKALSMVFLEVLKMYSPFVPHITEKIYQELYKGKEKGETLCNSTYKELPYYDGTVEFGEAVKDVVSTVRKYKTDRNQSMKERIGILNIGMTQENLEFLKDSIMDIKSCTSADDINVSVSDETTINIPTPEVEKGQMLVKETGK